MPSEVTKTRKIINTAQLELTEAEIVDYVIKGVKRDHAELKDYELIGLFDVQTYAGGVRYAMKITGERVS